jgi:hypothetical protein
MASVRHGAVSVIIDQGGDVFRFDHELKTLIRGGRVSEAEAYGEGVRPFGESVLIDVLVAQPGVERNLAGFEGLKERRWRGRLGRDIGLGEGRAGGGQGGEEEQNGFMVVVR